MSSDVSHWETGNGEQGKQGKQGHCVLEDTKLEPIVLVRFLWTWGAGAHTSTGGTGDVVRGRGTGDGSSIVQDGRPSQQAVRKTPKNPSGTIESRPPPLKKKSNSGAGRRARGGGESDYYTYLINFSYL
jgi:hypothetical protein